MKSQFSKLSIFFLLLLFVGAGCKENDDKCNTVAVKGAEDSVIGKWKQVKGESVFRNPLIVDYSCNEIIYHFKSDGTLTITSDIDNPIGYNSGNYTYVFSLNSMYENMEENHTLKIGDSSWGCSISESSMILNDAPLDGPILNFIRIE